VDVSRMACSKGSPKEEHRTKSSVKGKSKQAIRVKRMWLGQSVVIGNDSSPKGGEPKTAERRSEKKRDKNLGGGGESANSVR